MQAYLLTGTVYYVLVYGPFQTTTMQFAFFYYQNHFLAVQQSLTLLNQNLLNLVLINV